MGVSEPPAGDRSPSLEEQERETALIRAIRAGDEAACERVVRQQSGRILGTARRLLSNEEDARDAVQDAFLSAFRSIEGFQGASRLSTWLHRIVVNAALMKLRMRRRKPEQSIDELLPEFLEDGHQTPRSVKWSEPYAELERRETHALVHQCIDQLPVSYRTVLILRDIEELDTEETAKLLGVTQNAVKIRLHRARQALRTLLDPHFRGEAA